MTPLRIAYGRFMQESNSFSTVLTTRKDFERTHMKAGQTLAEACQPGQWEVEGFLKNLELSGALKSFNKHAQKDPIETIPLISAWSISGGPLEQVFFDEICAEFCERLKQAGPLDGILLALHGAMGVQNTADPEAVLLKRIREVVGDIPIAITLDLHANLTREKMQLADLICAYHTNPHFDMARTGAKAADLLVRTLRGEVELYRSWRSLPLLLGGGTGIHALPPMRAIFQRLKSLEKDPRVLNINVLMSHPYLNHPEMGWAIEVCTDSQAELAEEIADELAERCWQTRKQQPPRFLEVPEMLQKVRQAKLRRKWSATAVCDCSDVVGAGGTGENTHLLKALLEQAKDLTSYYPLRDPQAVQELWDQPLNQEYRIQVGGRLHPAMNPALQIKAVLRQRLESDNFGRMAYLDLGHVKLILTEGYAMPMKPNFYEDLVLNIRHADIVITKNFFHFRLYYALKCWQNLYVKTQGITDFERLAEIQLEVPAYPLTQMESWQEADALKRQSPESRPKVTVKSQPKRLPWLALTGALILGHLWFHKGIVPRFWKKPKA